MISQCLQLHVLAPGTWESSYHKTLKPEPVTANIVPSEWGETCIANINSSYCTLEHGAVCNIAHHTKQVDKMPQLFLK